MTRQIEVPCYEDDLFLVKRKIEWRLDLASYKGFSEYQVFVNDRLLRRPFRIVDGKLCIPIEDDLDAINYKIIFKYPEGTDQ